MALVRLKRLADGGFARNVATLAGGAALAQFLPLIAAPLLTRLYTPADFGLLSVYVAWLSALAVIATGRYELAIVLPSCDKRSANLFGLSLAIAASLAVLLGVVLWPASGFWADLMREPALAPWLWLLPLTVGLAGLAQAYTQWNNRRQRYRANAAGRLAQAVAMTALQLGLGFAGLGAGGLLIGQTAGVAASLIAQALPDWLAGAAWRRDVDLEGMKAVAREYSEFPRVNAANALVGAAQDTLTVTLLLTMSGSATVGFYGLMMRMLKLPAALVGQAVAQVAYRDLAAAHAAGEPLAPQIRKLFVLLTLLALPGAIVMAAFGPALFALVFGEGWREAGEYARALSPYMLCHFVASPLGMVPLVIRRQKAALAFTVVGNGLFLAVLWSGLASGWPLASTLWALSAAMAVYFFSYFAWIYKAVR
ncbi:lipopolysaccharide biosynthesis protein [Crenobacter cavernae]|uniref:lipopolysaccharide biosynthesis protein n=1 Tax=Crenobacter cavernae TaxID=2290923 RepID=UPI00141998B3|nr:oligosaccharide flippase family protein [Crenobacter cavernae]